MKPWKDHPRCQCGACGEDFSGIVLFDAHRVGDHEHDASPGLPLGRRCLSEEEMKAKGWVETPRGHWADPKAKERFKARFG